MRHNGLRMMLCDKKNAKKARGRTRDKNNNNPKTFFSTLREGVYVNRTKEVLLRLWLCTERRERRYKKKEEKNCHACK